VGHPFTAAGCPAALEGCPAVVAGHPFATAGCPPALTKRSARAVKPSIFFTSAHYQQLKLNSSSYFTQKF